MRRSPIRTWSGSGETAVDPAGLAEVGEREQRPLTGQISDSSNASRAHWPNGHKAGLDQPSSAAETASLRQLLTQSAQYGLELTKRNEELERKLAEEELEARSMLARVEQANRELLNRYAAQIEESEKVNASLRESGRAVQRELDAARGVCQDLRTELEALAEKVAGLDEVARSALAKASTAARTCAGLEQVVQVLHAQQEEQAARTERQFKAARDQSGRVSKTASELAKEVFELFSLQSATRAAVEQLEERTSHNENTLSNLVVEAKQCYEIIWEAQSAAAAAASTTGRTGQAELQQEPEAFSVEQERASPLRPEPLAFPPRSRALSLVDPMSVPYGFLRGVGFTASGFKYSLGLKYAALLQEQNSRRRASTAGPLVGDSVVGFTVMPRAGSAVDTALDRYVPRLRAADNDQRLASGSGKAGRTYAPTSAGETDASGPQPKLGEELPRSLVAKPGPGELPKEQRAEGADRTKDEQAAISF